MAIDILNHGPQEKEKLGSLLKERLKEQEKDVFHRFVGDDVPLRDWPKGQVGFLKSINIHCPMGKGSSWETGWRKHDTEDSCSNNQWSDPISIDGW